MFRPIRRTLARFRARRPSRACDRCCDLQATLHEHETQYDDARRFGQHGKAAFHGSRIGDTYAALDHHREHDHATQADVAAQRSRVPTAGA